MLELQWTEKAINQLADIAAFIAEFNPASAQKLKDEVEEKVRKLPEHPNLYKKSIYDETLREMVIRKNYKVFYEVTDKAIKILDVLHSRQSWEG